MSKAELLVLAQASLDAALAMKAGVESLSDEVPVDPQVAELQKKIEELSASIVSLQESISAKDALLAQVDIKAKELDSLVPDAVQ